MLDEIRALNVEFIKAYSELYENRKFLGTAQVEYMQAKLYETYSEEFSRLFLRHLIAHREEKFKLEEECATRIPHTWRFLWWHKENEAAKLIAEEVRQKSDKYFDEYTEKLFPPEEVEALAQDAELSPVSDRKPIRNAIETLRKALKSIKFPKRSKTVSEPTEEPAQAQTANEETGALAAKNKSQKAKTSKKSEEPQPTAEGFKQEILKLTK